MSASSPSSKAPRAGSALEHPLPAGMRDLLPVEARTLADLGRKLLETFELYGYQRVTVPAFEYAEVLERGLGELDPREVLRFVEPETGEVVALRPDMTPQIARLVATRLASVPGPARLAYEGSVVRLRRERARRHRQIPQAGIELVGCPAVEGDEEVLAVACASVRSAGLDDFVLDLGHARVAGSLLELVAEGDRARLVEALAVKDPLELERRARAAGLDAGLARPLVGLAELHGDSAIWPEVETLLRGTPAEGAARELYRVFEAVSELGLARDISLDFGEVRDLGYYTGVTFQILAEGPGEAVAAGGRYDGLLEKFGAPRPAAGFAVALDDLLWALGQGAPPSAPRVLVSGSSPEVKAVLSALRQLGVAAARAGEDPSAHAEAFGYTHLVELGESAGLRDLRSGSSQALAARGGLELGQEIALLVASRVVAQDPRSRSTS